MTQHNICDHMQICYHVWNNVGHGCPYDNHDQNLEGKVCKHDTRSCPVPATPFPITCPDCEGRMFKTVSMSENENHPCGRIIPCNTCNGRGLITQEQHDTIIAAQARKEVLDALATKFKQKMQCGGHTMILDMNDVDEIFRRYGVII